MATTERQPPSSIEGSSPSRPTMFHRLSDNAIDETSDADSDFVKLQKTISKERREARESPQARLQRACPFTFHPNIRPLSKSDYESCIALENAAFPDPAHRATPEKASSPCANMGSMRRAEPLTNSNGRSSITDSQPVLS